MKVNVDNLMKSGYKSFTDPTNNNVIGYQKRIYLDDGKTAYFITFKDFSESFRSFGMRESIIEGNAFSVSSQMSLPKEDQVFNVEYFIDKEMTIEEVETFYSDVYTKLGCVPDWHNND